MNENDQAHDPRIRELLRQARMAPGLPPRFQEQVWRRIELAEAPVETGSWLDRLANLIMRPRFALPAAAAVLLAGIVAGTLEGRLAARHDAQMNYLASVAPQAGFNPSH
jgi:hypothetical protein